MQASSDIARDSPGCGDAAADCGPSIAVKPLPAMPPRPARRLSTPQRLRVALSNTLAACDEELFEAPIVERRYIWGRFFSISDPDGIRRVMQDNVDNYPRIEVLHRVFAFTAGTGMLAAEGELWRRHRRVLNPTLDHRAVLADVPVMVELSEILAEHLARLPAGQEIDIGAAFAHLVTAITGRVFAANDRAIDPVLYRLGQYPGKYSLFDFGAAPRLGERLHRELDQVLGGRPPNEDDLPSLTYLRQVIDESLRLYPPAPTMLRSAVADDVVCGRRVPRKSIVGVFPWVVHRHRTLWREPDS